MLILLKKVFPTFEPQIKVFQMKAACIYCVELKWRILMCDRGLEIEWRRLYVLETSLPSQRSLRGRP